METGQNLQDCFLLKIAPVLQVICPDGFAGKSAEACCYDTNALCAGFRNSGSWAAAAAP